MHIDDVIAFILNCIIRPRPLGLYSDYGFDVYLPNVIASFQAEVENQPLGLQSSWRDGPRARELSPVFYEAAWHLCRRGILRPGVPALGDRDDGGRGGYTITSLGRAWIEKGIPASVPVDSSRLIQLFETISGHVGAGFLQRAQEAAQCHAMGCYLASCAMCGAAAESIVLAVATAKSGDEEETLKIYRSSAGRHKIIERTVAGLSQSIAAPFGSATGLLSFWRDEAAHGRASEISEIEAHEALARLIRFAQFINEKWSELTAARIAQ